MKKKTGCKTDGCRQPRQKGRSLCCRCEYKRRKESDRVAVAFQQLRQNARRRKKAFTITLEYFRQFAYEVDLLVGRGRTAKSYHVDRIRDHLGYIPGNLQKLTCSENVQKGNARRRRKVLAYDVETRTGTYFETGIAAAAAADPDCPF